MGLMDIFGEFERREAEYLYMSPQMGRIPNIITLARLNEILTYKGFDTVTETKGDFLIAMISGIIFRVTGLFWGEKTLTLYYERKDGANVFPTPLQCESVSLITNDGDTVDSGRYSIKPYEVFLDDGLLYDYISITGVFGDSSGIIPNDIETAISFLVEDLLFGDKYDRMQSIAHELTLDKLEIIMPNSGSYISGSREIDRMLKPYRFQNYDIMFRNQGGAKMTAL